MTALPVPESAKTVIVLRPGCSARTSPLGESATAVPQHSMVHCTGRKAGPVAFPWMSRTVAVSCSTLPTGTVAAEGETVTEIP